MTFGSSHIAYPAYHDKPTMREYYIQWSGSRLGTPPNLTHLKFENRSQLFQPRTR